MAIDQKYHQLRPQLPGLDQKQILLVGYRRPIVDVLERLQIRFAVWHDKPIKRNPNCLKSIAQPFPSQSKHIRTLAEQEFSEFGAFSHVIAGTEAAVYVASVCRRALGAQKSKDSIALRCSDKQKMKALMKLHHVPMTDYLTQSEALSLEQIFERLGPKVVVKQPRNSGGRGLSIAHSLDELTARKERGLLYERFVDANELSVETFIRHGEIQFTSTTNYLVKTHANVVPANIPPRILGQVQAINRDVVAALKLSWGLTHAEFYWNADQVLFGEIALRPPGGYIMECMSLAHAFDAWEAFVANEIDLPYTFPSQSDQTAGVAILHAGEGRVQQVLNVDQVRQLPSCVHFKVLVKPGDWVSARVGVGEVSAYGLFVSKSAQETERDVLNCLTSIRFQLEQSSELS